MTIYSMSWCEDIITGDDISDAIAALREENNRTEENTATLKVLIEARKEIKSTIYSENDFTSVTLINDNYFESFIREQVYGDHEDLDAWPFKHIDWEQAAEEIASDYHTLDVEGNTFYYID